MQQADGTKSADAPLRAAPFPAAVIDEDGTLALVNAAFASAFGLGDPALLEGQAAARAVGARLEPAGRDALDAALVAARDVRSVESIEAAVDRRWWAFTVTPLPDDARLLLTAQDAQGERIAELFAAVIGHDVRNALSTVSTGVALLLRRGGLNEQQEQHVRRMQGGGVRIARMVSQVLEVLRSHGAGGLSLFREPTSLTEVVARVVADARARHPDRAVALQLPETARGDWDTERVEQIVREVVGNAFAHGDPAVKIEVTLTSKEREVELVVSNRGAAMTDATRAAVLDPLRAPRSRVKQKGGAGLGVYVAELLARAHGGSLALTSNDDSVSVVVRLPR